ncbi:hypothetical protein LXL04_024126 [Taraxacum kok-saghyz]
MLLRHSQLFGSEVSKASEQRHSQLFNFRSLQGFGQLSKVVFSSEPTSSEPILFRKFPSLPSLALPNQHLRKPSEVPSVPNPVPNPFFPRMPSIPRLANPNLGFESKIPLPSECVSSEGSQSESVCIQLIMKCYGICSKIGTIDKMMGFTWATEMIPAATPEEEAAKEAAQWLQPDDDPASPPPRVETEILGSPPLHPLDPYNQPEPKEEEDPEEDPEEDLEENDFDPPGYDIEEDSDEEESEMDDVDDAMVIDPVYPVRSMYEPTPASFDVFRHPGGPLWMHTPRKSVPPVTLANAPTLPFPVVWQAREREGPSSGEEGESSRPIPLPANTGGPISGEMALMRDRLARLEAQATSFDGEIGHLKRGNQSPAARNRGMCEAALAATRAALAATQAELDRLKLKEDIKQKGPTE